MQSFSLHPKPAQERYSNFLCVKPHLYVLGSTLESGSRKSDSGKAAIVFASAMSDSGDSATTTGDGVINSDGVSFDTVLSYRDLLAGLGPVLKGRWEEEGDGWREPTGAY